MKLCNVNKSILGLSIAECAAIDYLPEIDTLELVNAITVNDYSNITYGGDGIITGYKRNGIKHSALENNGTVYVNNELGDCCVYEFKCGNLSAYASGGVKMAIIQRRKYVIVEHEGEFVESILLGDDGKIVDAVCAEITTIASKEDSLLVIGKSCNLLFKINGTHISCTNLITATTSTLTAIGESNVPMFGTNLHKPRFRNIMCYDNSEAMLAAISKNVFYAVASPTRVGLLIGCVEFDGKETPSLFSTLDDANNEYQEIADAHYEAVNSELRDNDMVFEDEVIAVTYNEDGTLTRLDVETLQPYDDHIEVTFKR